MTLTDRSIAGFLQLGASHLLLVLVRLGVIAVLARLVAPEDFGTTQAAMIVVALAEGVAHLNLGAALVQIKSLRDEHVVSAFLFALIAGSVAGVCIGVGAVPIAAGFRMPALAKVLVLLSFTVPANALASVACALLQRRLRYRHIARVEVVSYVLGFGGVGVALACLQWGLWALIGAAMAHFFARSIGFCTLVVPMVEGRPSWNGFRQLVRFGGGFSLSVLLNQLALRGDQIIIGRCLGNQMLGIYSRALGVMNVSVAAFGKSLDLVAFSSMSRKQAQLDALSLAYQRSLSAVALLVMPASAVAVVLGPEIIQLLLGPAWSSAVVPFQVLAVGVYFRVGYKVSGALLRSLGQVYAIAVRQAAYLLLILGGAWLGHFWGLAGASVGVVVAIGGHYLQFCSMAVRLLPDMDWRRMIRTVLPGAALAVGVLAVASTVAGIARIYRCSEWGVCLVTCMTTATFIAGLVRAYPQCLGHDGCWILQKVVRDHFPEWIRRVPAASGKPRASEGSYRI